MEETTEKLGKKGQKTQGKPHTGMVEFKYSKIIQDYLRKKDNLPFDLALFKRMNPKREAMDVILHNILEGNICKDVVISSYIMRTGNFGTPALNLSAPTPVSNVGSLPSIAHTGFRAETGMSNWSITQSRPKVPASIFEDEDFLSSKIKLPPIKSNMTVENSLTTQQMENASSKAKLKSGDIQTTIKPPKGLKRSKTFYGT